VATTDARSGWTSLKDSRIIVLKRSKATQDINISLEAILRQLELHGRAVTENGHASRFFAHRMRQPKKNGDVYIKWHQDQQKSVITLKPGIVLKKINENKIKLIYGVE